MGVWLDPRKGSGDLLGEFTTGFAQLLQLDSADVMGVGNGPEGTILWGAEIKKLGDTLQSLQDGRLVAQLGLMEEEYDWKFLIVEGETREHWDSGYLQNRLKKTYKGKQTEFWVDTIFGAKQKIMYQHYMSWLFSTTFCSGTYLIQTVGRKETASVVVGLCRFFEKQWDEHSSMKVFNDSSRPEMYVPSIAQTVARSLAAGIGWDKAALAADKFQTARGVVNATVEEWREVDGIDKVLAERAVEGANKAHEIRKRTRRSNGATHSNFLPAPRHSVPNKRGRGAGKVSRPAR